MTPHQPLTAAHVGSRRLRGVQMIPLYHMAHHDPEAAYIGKDGCRHKHEVIGDRHSFWEWAFVGLIFAGICAMMVSL